MPAKAANKTAAKPAAKAAAKPAAPAKAAPKAAAAAGNGVYVTGLGDADRATITALFEAKCGKVTGVQLRRNKYAQVFFENSASVKKAQEAFNGKEVRGQLVTVAVAKSGPKPSATAGATTVCVYPIYRASTTRKQIFALFASAGKVARLRTYADNSAFVYFNDAASAQKAIAEKNGTEYQNQTLSVKASVRTLAKDAAAEKTRKQLIAVRKFQAENRA